MNQYKLYCINENKKMIVKGFNTTDKKQIANEVKSYLSKIYGGKNISENLIITSNPQGYGLNPKNQTSWLNVKKEMRNEAITNRITDQIYESIVKEAFLSPKLNQQYNVHPGQAAEKKQNFERVVSAWLRTRGQYLDNAQFAKELKAKLDELAAEEENDDAFESEINRPNNNNNNNNNNFQESIKRLVTQNINESLNEAYVQSRSKTQPKKQEVKTTKKNK